MVTRKKLARSFWVVIKCGLHTTSTGKSTLGLDLLANPFAVLGLTHDASMPAISARAREVGGADALAARSLLIAPRSRLQAELGYVPGASGPQVGACLTSLRGRTAPDLSTLGPQAQANVIAHLAFLGLASSGNLRRLFALQPAIAAAARSMLETGREAARLPAIPEDMLDAALLALAAQHAEAFGVGALALADGAALFSALVRDPATSAAVRAGFLRDAATAWELASAAGADADCDAAAPIEAELRDRCSQRKVVELANCIKAFTRRTEPPRELARTFGLPHQASWQPWSAGTRWHSTSTTDRAPSPRR